MRRTRPRPPYHPIFRWGRLGLFGVMVALIGLDACTGDDPLSVPGGFVENEAGRQDSEIADRHTDDSSNNGDVSREVGPGDPRSPCAELVDASFCDDFNDSVLPFRWSKSTSGDGSAVELIEAGGTFGSPAVGASIPKGLNLAGASITFTRAVARSARVRGDFRIPSFGMAAGDYVMLLVVIVPTTPRVAARVISRPYAGSVALSVVDDTNGTDLFVKELVGWNFSDWTPIDLEVVAAPMISASLRIGTPSLLLASSPGFPLDASPAAQPGAAFFGAGVTLSSSTGAATLVRVDNVAVWSE